MNIPKTFILVAVKMLLFGHLSASGPTLLLYLQEPPARVLHTVSKELDKPSQIDRISNLTKKSTSKMEKRAVEGALRHNGVNDIAPPVGGFLATYAAYVDYSDKDGRISFPLKEAHTDTIYLLITPGIDLVSIEGNTISHASLDPNIDNRAVLYAYEQKTDKKTKQLFWHVRKMELPLTDQLGPHYIMLITKPRNIYVEEGDFMTEKSANAALPNNIYVVGNDSNVRSILKALNTDRFTEQIKYITNIPNKNLQQQIITND